MNNFDNYQFRKKNHSIKIIDIKNRYLKKSFTPRYNQYSNSFFFFNKKNNYKQSRASFQINNNNNYNLISPRLNTTTLIKSPNKPNYLTRKINYSNYNTNKNIKSFKTNNFNSNNKLSRPYVNKMNIFSISKKRYNYYTRKKNIYNSNSDIIIENDLLNNNYDNSSFINKSEKNYNESIKYVNKISNAITKFNLNEQEDSKPNNNNYKQHTKAKSFLKDGILNIDVKENSSTNLTDIINSFINNAESPTNEEKKYENINNNEKSEEYIIEKLKRKKNKNDDNINNFDSKLLGIINSDNSLNKKIEDLKSDIDRAFFEKEYLVEENICEKLNNSYENKQINFNYKSTFSDLEEINFDSIGL